MNRYNFLDKTVGLSTLVELRGNLGIDSNLRIVETQIPLSVPGLEGLQIPRDSRGHVLKVINDNTALVRWEVIFKYFLFHFLNNFLSVKYYFVWCLCLSTFNTCYLLLFM